MIQSTVKGGVIDKCKYIYFISICLCMYDSFIVAAKILPRSYTL
jgi:hypothetical protein